MVLLQTRFTITRPTVIKDSPIRVQKGMHPERRKYFKRSRKLLLTDFNKLKPENKDALTIMLSLSSNLATAYYLKELFYDFISSKNSEEAKQKLKNFSPPLLTKKSGRR